MAFNPYIPPPVPTSFAAVSRSRKSPLGQTTTPAPTAAGVAPSPGALQGKTTPSNQTAPQQAAAQTPGAGSAATAATVGTITPQAQDQGYQQFSASAANAPQNTPAEWLNAVTNAGPYNPQFAARRSQAQNSFDLGAIQQSDAFTTENAKRNDFYERNSPIAQMREQAALQQKATTAANQRADTLAQNDFLDAERLRGQARAQQVEDRNAAMTQSMATNLLASGAFGRYDPGGMGTDRSNVSLDALNSYMRGQQRTPGGGLSMTTGLTPTAGYQATPTGTPTNLKPTAADTYWAQKRTNDLEGERTALANAQRQAEWDRMDRAAWYAGSGPYDRSNAGTAGARAGVGTSGTEQPVFDPALYRQITQELERGISAPAPVEMPAAPAEVAAMSSPTINDSAAFGRARSRIGQGTSAALRALQNQMTARGISGSGIEARQMTDLYGQGLGQLGEASRDAAIAQNEQDRQVAQSNYQGALSQRGQNLGYANSTLNARVQNQQAAQQWALATLANRQQFAPLMLRNNAGAILRY